MLDKVRAAQRAATRSALSREQAPSAINVDERFDSILILLPLIVVDQPWFTLQVFHDPSQRAPIVLRGAAIIVQSSLAG